MYFSKSMIRALTVGGAIGAVILPAMRAHATTYTIQTLDMSSTSAPGCGFMEAVASVNAGNGMNGCAAPTGSDEIYLDAIGTYTTSAQILVQKPVTISGRGRTNTTVSAALGLRVDANVGSGNVAVVIESLKVLKHGNQVSTVPGIGQYGHATKLVDLTLYDVEVTGFTSSSSNAVYVTAPGAGHINTSTNLYIYDSYIHDNAGTGIRALGDGTSLSLWRTIVYRNMNRGLYLSEGRTDIHFSSFEENSTAGHGGGIYQTATAAGDPENQSNLTLYDSLIANNFANSGDGGGIFYNGRNGADIQRSTITGNHSGSAPTTGRGGGLYSLRQAVAYLRIQNSTIAFNRARSQGGGLWDNNSGNGTPLAVSTIFAKNLLGLSTSPSGSPSTNGTDVYFQGAQGIDTLYSLYGTRQGVILPCFGAPPPSGGCPPNQVPATSGSSIDPQLLSLAKVGGSTKVHRFQSTSPALDYVDCTIMSSPTDQRGFRTGIDYDFVNDGTECDIGAYEAGGYDDLPSGPPPGGFTSYRPAAMTSTDPATGIKYLEVFATGSDGHLYGTAAPFQPDGSLGDWWSYDFVTDAFTAYAPAVVPMPNNEAYILVTSGEDLWAQRRFSNHTLDVWEYLGAFVASAPVAVNANNQDAWAFVRGLDDNLFYQFYNGEEWIGWYEVPVGPSFQGNPTAAYLSGTNRVYVFARRLDGQLAYRYYNRGTLTWSSSWITIPGALSWDPTAVARTSSNIDLYGLNSSGRLIVATLSSTGTFTGWSTRPNSSAGGMSVPPGAWSRGNGLPIDVLTVPASGQIERQETPW